MWLVCILLILYINYIYRLCKNNTYSPTQKRIITTDGSVLKQDSSDNSKSASPKNPGRSLILGGLHSWCLTWKVYCSSCHNRNAEFPKQSQLSCYLSMVSFLILRCFPSLLEKWLKIHSYWGQIGTQFVLLRLPFATAGEPTRWPRIMLLLVAPRSWREGEVSDCCCCWWWWWWSIMNIYDIYIYRVTPKFSQDDVDYQDTKDAASSRFCRSLWPCAVRARCSCCAPKRADAAGVLAAVCGIRPLRPGRLWDGYRIDIPGSPRTQKVRPCLIHHDVPFEVPDLKRNASKGTLLYIASLIVSNREWSWAGS